ncbi:MAG: aldehyde dehydrogenase [Alphaproteobacteria bacterium]
MEIKNFIAGKHVPPLSGQYFNDFDPAIGEPYARVPDSDGKDLDIAVEAAKKAFPAWRDTPAEERARMLEKLASLMEAKKDAFVDAESRDTGKPLWLAAQVDVPRGIANLRAFADAAREFGGQTFDKPESKSYTLRQPIGVVSIISPWNLPLLLFTWKLAPAVAAGNCVIAKPSEVTPMTAYMLSELINEAGFPAGVINILHGRGAKIGAAITEHPDISAISFTGGTATGTTIYSGAAKHLKKVSLELGGKNPTIVFDDADMQKTMPEVLRAAFANQGQVCLCGSRLFIQRGIYDEFKKHFVAAAQSNVVGDPQDATTKLGAMVSHDHMQKVLGYIELAKEEGGRILTGGKRKQLQGRCEHGYFIEPTVIEGLSHTCRTNQEEIFGPVVTLIPFTDEADVITMANSTEYGLAASVWTKDEAKAARVAEKLESGIVWLNCWNLRDLDTPFGGVKKSGIGREGKWRALEFFTNEKTVTTLRKECLT